MSGSCGAPGPGELNSSVASDLTAIRALLQAIAEHNLIEVPKEASSLAISRSTADVDPGGDSYDEAETIDYHIRQLSNQKLTRLSSKRGDSLTSKLGTAATLLRSDHLEPGIYSSVLWESDTLPHDRHIDYDEFGYDKNGYPCSLRQGDAVPKQHAHRPRNTSYAPQPREIIEIEEHIVRTTPIMSSYLILRVLSSRRQTAKP